MDAHKLIPLLTLLAAGLLASPGAQSASQARSALPPATYTDDAAKGWELKGVQLGGSVADAKAKFPSLECLSPTSGIEFCSTRQFEFAGGNGRLMLKYLDGRLVMVKIAELSRGQATSAGLGLEQKFGAPSSDRMVRRSVGDGSRMESARWAMWRAPNIMLFVAPFEERDGGDRTAAVTLFDVQGHDYQWLPRSQGKPVHVATDI